MEDTIARAGAGAESARGMDLPVDKLKVSDTYGRHCIQHWRIAPPWRHFVHTLCMHHAAYNWHDSPTRLVIL
jgi:hypothetical protein